VDAGDAEAEGGELGGLVVHEGDERRDDQGRSSASESGELVAEALAGSGGHDEEDVATGGGGLADHLLVGAEVAVTEDAVEKLGEGLGWLERGHLLRFIFAWCCAHGEELRVVRPVDRGPMEKGVRWGTPLPPQMCFLPVSSSQHCG